MNSDAELVRAAQNGDRQAFAALVARHERTAWATARFVLRDHHTAADATQEAFLQAYSQLRTLRDPSRFGVWLLQIARRAAIRFARQRGRQQATLIDAAVDRQPCRDDGSSVGLSADSEELLSAIAQLPKHERLVIIHRYIDGHSVAEIAALCGRPVGTVTKQLSRAVERLRFALKEVNS